MFNSANLKSKKSLIYRLLVLTICFFSLIYSYFYGSSPVSAHRPHDVVIQVRVSPEYENDQTLFIIVRHNLFKSVDGGKSWQRIIKGIDATGFLMDLSGDQKSNQVMYLSTNYDGIYKTEDGGDSWFKVNNGLNTLILDQLFVDPNSAEFVVAAGNDKKLYKTEDGGSTWQETLTADANITAILITENEGTIIAGDEQGNLYISRNRGQEWQESKLLSQDDTGAITAITTANDHLWIGTAKKGVYKSTEQGFVATNQGLGDLRITDLLANDSTNLYASTWDQGFFISNDDGDTWTKSIQGLQKDAQADQLKEPHFSVLAKSGNNIFLGGFDGLFKSEDLGKSWNLLETLSLGTVVSYDISPNYLNDQTLAIVTYVGNFYLSQDGGKTWTPRNKGLEIARLDSNYVPYKTQHPRRFFDIAFSPNYENDQTIFSSLLWTQVAISNNQAESWNVVSLPSEVRGIQIVPSPNYASDQTVYVANQQGLIFKSTNGGKNFSLAGKIGQAPGNDPPSLVISPNFASDQTLYSYTDQGIYKSTDGGKKWTSVNLKGKHDLQLAISPNYQNDQILLASSHLGLFKTEDQGKSWVNLSIAELGLDHYLDGVAISPNYENDQTIIVSARGKGLYKSVDGGQNFQAIGDRNLPYSRMWQVPSSGLAVRFSPNYAQDNTIYSFGSATTEMYKSTDGGKTWATLSVPINPVPMVEEYDLSTSVSLWYSLYRGKIFQFFLAVVVGLIAYIVVGFFPWEKQIPLSKSQIKLFSGFVSFLLVFFLLNQI
jgi:photosystem II stability/assembly factor-like uncharacterized protein